jgi:UDP-GlcNAc:undecaprenyl-phosphate GlcNAc-1-phosphate transferase
MKSYIVAFVAAALLSAALIPFVRRFAMRVGAVSHPGGRNVHRQSVPRLGGVPICIAFLAPVVGLFFFPESVVGRAVITDIGKVLGVAAGGVFMCAVGAYDDARGVRAAYKLLAQIGVACFAFACGFRIDGVALPWIETIPTGVLALPVTVLWFVGVINAINLIDGLDGLAGGVVFFAGVTNFTVAAFIMNELFTALLLASMLGATLAFLFHNSNPARIFMGDSGSYFLGFMLAATSLSGGAPKTSTAVALLVPVLALGVPIFDTLFAMTRRLIERRPLFSPDRGHIHHRLLDLGLTHQRAVLILYGLTLVLTVGAIAISLGRSWDTGAAMLIGSVALVALIRVFSGIRRRELAWSQSGRRLRAALPGLPLALEGARSEDELYEALGRFAESVRFDFVELAAIAPGTDAPRPTFVWPEGQPPRGGFHVTVSFFLGDEACARGTVRFGWTTDDGDREPEVEVLLVIVADVLERQLARLGSPLAPLPGSLPAPRVPRPAREPEAPLSVRSLAAPPSRP